MKVTLTQPTNRIIASLPEKNGERLIALCEACELGASQALDDVNFPSQKIYFPLGAVISVVACTDESDILGLSLVGREGVLGSECMSDPFSHSTRAIVQCAGPALRISFDLLRKECAENALLKSQLAQHANQLARQFARSAACSHFHEIAPRLARWLLITQDRSRSNEFHVTQEFLGAMLGVRRVGVTCAASLFQQNGLIEYHRGDLVILNRVGLKACACSCYKTDLNGDQNTVAAN